MQKYIVIGVVVGVLLSSAAIALAGSLDPHSGPSDAASQMYTLEQIYDRLDTGAVSAKMTSFTEPVAGPGPTGRTLDEVMNLAMKVGNPDPPCFDNTNRYVDCGNGTVHDTVTNLIWLKNANCFGQLDYAAANNAAAGLEDGECGLTDGSSPGDWRLPTETEWKATKAQAAALGCTGAAGPTLTNTPGTACYNAGPQSFTDVQVNGYLTSSASGGAPSTVIVASIVDGGVYNIPKTATADVWPVRAP